MNALLIAEWEYGGTVDVGAAESVGELLRDLNDAVGEDMSEVARIVGGLSHGVTGAALAAAARALRDLAWAMPTLADEPSSIPLQPDNGSAVSRVLALAALLDHAAMLAGDRGVVRTQERT
ncbi:MAG: hypothetical protein Q8O67_11835 [Deltaproteobacteria bacterium]|nr:hypothetical protein [Deltaproteobacteria bacterium]